MSIKASATTVLQFGMAAAPVALFKTTGDPEKLQPFEKAGPHGARLERVPVRRQPGEDLGRRLLGGVANPPAATAVADDPLDSTMHGSPKTSDPLPTATLGVGTCEVGYDDELDDADVREGLFVKNEEDGTERFVDLTDQLEDVRESTKLESMEVIAFIRREQVPRARVQGSYYLGADGPGAGKVLRLLVEAIRSVGRVPVVTWTKRSRQSLGVITVNSQGALIVLDLAWAAQVRKPEARQMAHMAVEVTAAEVAAASALAAAYADSPAVIDEQEDERVVLERELREKALAGELETFAAPVPEEVPEGLSLEDVLKASLDAVVARR